MSKTDSSFEGGEIRVGSPLFKILFWGVIAAAVFGGTIFAAGYYAGQAS